MYVASTEKLGLDVELDLRRLAGDSSVSTIFDVGANIGQTACRFASAFPAACIYSFEPVASSFAQLRKNVSALRNVHPINVALGETAGRASINIAEQSGSNSLSPAVSGVDTEIISVATLDSVAAAYNINSIDLLKIDVEGFELPVLRGAKEQLTRQTIRFVYAECVLHPNDEMPHTSFFELHNLLTSFGFCFVTYYPESFHLKLGAAMGNVLYAYKDRLPASVPGVGNIV